MSAHNLNNYIQFDGVFNQIFPGFVISPFRYFNWRIKRCDKFTIYTFEVYTFTNSIEFVF